MTLNAMRTALAEVYPGPKWRLKCQTMEDRQVLAIYKSMERKGQLNKKRQKKKHNEPGIFKAEQITMVELYPSLFISAN